MSRRAAVWLVIATAVLFSTGGAAIKLTQLGAWQVAGGRAAVAAIAILLLAPGSRRGWNWRTLMVGAAYAATVLLYVHSNKLTTAAATIFLQSTAPLFVILLSPLLVGETPRRRDLLFAPAFALGLALCFLDRTGATTTAPQPMLGNALALAGGLTYGLTLLGLRALGRPPEPAAMEPRVGEGRAGNPGLAAVACGNVIAAVVSLPWALPVHEISSTDVGVLLFLGVFQIGLAYALMTRALRHLTAVEGALLLLFEPVLNPLWAALLLGELPGPWTSAGGMVLVGATAYKAWSEP
ncbi:MAG TPA: DMT family transporter [Thermoanaerobaculia bacterium]|nr:DMT family transporter [Thermoanaerobaculia bacterium]